MAKQNSTSTMFLSADDVRTLTGRAHKAQQIAQLRTMGVPFWINAAGCPIVACAAVEGGKAKAVEDKAWAPAVLQRH